MFTMGVKNFRLQYFNILHISSFPMFILCIDIIPSCFILHNSFRSFQFTFWTFVVSNPRFCIVFVLAFLDSRYSSFHVNMVSTVIGKNANRLRQYQFCQLLLNCFRALFSLVVVRYLRRKFFYNKDVIKRSSNVW